MIERRTGRRHRQLILDFLAVAPFDKAAGAAFRFWPSPDGGSVWRRQTGAVSAHWFGAMSARTGYSSSTWITASTLRRRPRHRLLTRGAFHPEGTILMRGSSRS